MNSPHGKLKPGDRVRNEKDRIGTVAEVGWNNEAGTQLYVTVHWDDTTPGSISPAKAEELFLADGH